MDRLYSIMVKVASPTGDASSLASKLKPMLRGRIQGVAYQGTPGPKGNYPSVSNKQADIAAKRYGVKAPRVGVKANVMQARADRNSMPLAKMNAKGQPVRNPDGSLVMQPPRNPAKGARQAERAEIYRGKENAWVEGATSKRIKKHYGK